MTTSVRILSCLCLLAAFIWQIGTETQWVTASHAEEEEKKINIIFGNISLKSTPPPLEDGSTSVTRSVSKEFISTAEELPAVDTRKVDRNLTDLDELHENVNKNDASPENSVERESLEDDDEFHKDNPETDVLLENSKESSVEYAETLSGDKSTESYEDPSEDVALSVTSPGCSEGDAKCRNASDVQYEQPPRVDEKTSQTTASLAASSHSPSLWNIFRSMKPPDEANRTRYADFTPSKTAVYLSTTTESSTMAQTDENLIPVEGTVINKLDSSSDPLINKTEKAKPSKYIDSSSTSEDRLVRTFVKFLTTVPVTTLSKDTDERERGTTLLSKVFEAASTPAPYSDYDFNMSTIDWLTSKALFESSPRYEDRVSPSAFPEYSSVMPEENSSSLSLSTTASWDRDRTRNSDDKMSNDTGGSEPTPRLLPSFRESSISSVNKVPGSRITTSSLEVTSEASYARPSSSPHLPVTLQPQLSSRSVVRDSTPIDSSGREEHIPPPRLTNPGCSSLPICIEITLLDTTWDEFCPQAKEFQDFLAKDVSHIIHAIHAHQVILEADNCVANSPVYPVQVSPDVTVALFVTDDSGEYNEKLTEVCALILRKWAPTTFRNSVMEVRLFNNDLQATSIPLIPELNSGFVAAVSISAVAGVALCMLCILLVVMKQKLLQSRNSDTASPAADAYSLDSLSINASFRRRRNRKSARSYLNHAFSDQEIPSHPLNEKSLQNCLKNRELLEEEFKKIPLNMPKLDQIPEGAHVKNRYSNILPRPETRVLLADPSGDPLKCYINANYVKGHAGKPSTYIACQAPLPEGIEDFWRMVWEQQSRVIIMLTMFEENGTSRCAAYFPESTLVSHPPYGDFQVSLLKKEVYEFYTLSTFRLLEMEKNLFRDVVHLWFTNWPDVGVPKDPSTLVYFVQQCRSFINCNAGPTVVHCSTGTGRTGVFLALDICVREYDESRSIDILQCVSQLRHDRGGAVQNKDQYILIHEAILEYISRLANQSQRSSIQS